MLWMFLGSIVLATGFMGFGFFRYKMKKLELKHESDMEKRLSSRLSMDD